MQKRIAGAVGQFDKPEPPFGLEPLDDGPYRRPGGRVEAGWGEARRGAEVTQMRVVTIIVEIAAARLAEIPISDQVRFLSESVRGPVETAEPDCSKKSPRTRVLNFARGLVRGSPFDGVDRPASRAGEPSALPPRKRGFRISEPTDSAGVWPARLRSSLSCWRSTECSKNSRLQSAR